jgi:hypothetical protein
MPVIQPITSASSGSAYVPTSRILTINNVSYDLTQDRDWTVEVIDDLIATAPLSYNSGTNTLSITAANGSSDGYLLASDWTIFNDKQNTLILTTTGNNGSATFDGTTLNIPEYTLAGLGGMANVFTTLGDMVYSNSAGAPVRRSPNISTTKMFLSQTGDGTSSAAPQWSAVTAADVNAVPYTGATGNVNLGEYGMTVGYLGFDLTPTATPTTQGTMYWDDNGETVALIMNGTIQKIGEDTFYHVKNETGSTIPKGTAVRFDGTDGGSGKLLIAPFIADGSYPSLYYMGITSEEIINGASGKVYHFGKMRMVNTSAFTDGDLLYCSSTTAGGFQTTPPVAPNNIIVAAAVVNAANNGTLMIRSTLGSNINQDEGVKITSPSNNQLLKYNSTSGLWENFTPTFVSNTRTLTINDVVFDLTANREWSVGDFGTW